ncbi:neuropeptide Y receptor type 6-like [Arapaima gigas]
MTLRGARRSNSTVFKPDFADYDCQGFSYVFLVLVGGYILVTLVGLFGNLCLIHIIRPQKEAHNVTNLLIANLSLSDVLICIICIPFTVVYTLMDYWVFGETMCKERDSRLSESKHISVILVSTVLTFAVCWLPLNISSIIFDWHHEALLNSHHSLVFTICHLVAMISTCINPIFYGLLNKNFQQDLNNMIHQWKCDSGSEEYEDIRMTIKHADGSVGLLMHNVPNDRTGIS